MTSLRRLFALAAVTLLLTACQSAYYGAMERMGVPKREILVDRVAAARDSQEEAKEQFQDALDQFRAIVKVDAGKLEATYERLRDEYEDSVDRADAVRERIDAVESVADALFAEWEHELGEYSSASLRRQSQRELTQTRARYRRLIGQMHQAEARMDPVLEAFQDQVLILKHNLNARAIAALQSEVRTVEADISGLIREMEASIAEANAFLSSLQKQ